MIWYFNIWPVPQSCFYPKLVGVSPDLLSAGLVTCHWETQAGELEYHSLVDTSGRVPSTLVVMKAGVQIVVLFYLLHFIHFILTSDHHTLRKTTGCCCCCCILLSKQIILIQNVPYMKENFLPTAVTVRSSTSAPMVSLYWRVAHSGQFGLGVAKLVTGRIMFTANKVPKQDKISCNLTWDFFLFRWGAWGQ